jgi:hypothetical protein
MSPNPKRIASFFRRVEFEREVLRAVNTLPMVYTHLHGLSPGARDAWLSNEPAVVRIQGLISLLDEAWSLLGQLADHSRAVFENAESGDEEIDEFLNRLVSFCAKCRHSGANALLV